MLPLPTICHLRRSLAGLALLLAGATVSAQTTHQVFLNGFSFSDPDLTVALGDTVEWTWIGGLHNVESGVGGVHDGIFRSGDLETSIGQSYRVTFDAAFLAANPVAGDDYDYYCISHFGFGMVGRVSVRPPASSVVRNGSGSNPQTLSSSGGPVLGQPWDAFLDCSAHAPALGVYLGYGAPATAPIVLPAGEFLLDPGSGQAVLRVGQHLGGTLTFDFQIPLDPALCGAALYTQGVCLGSPGRRFSNALDVVAGP